MDDWFYALMESVIDTHVSDVHFSFLNSTLIIEGRRFKKTIFAYEVKSGNLYFEYLKYLAHIDLISSNLPQSSSFSYVLNKQVYYLRLSVMESFEHRNCVLRVLNLIQFPSLNRCIKDDQVVFQIQSFMKRINGCILFSGITGSGKSTTMFTALKGLQERKIYSLEDPIECVYDFITQVELNRALGLTFESGIKQLLRHDPDIMVIGEIRDRKEARDMVQCALSGHLVCTTIHAASAYHTIVRLFEFELRPYEIISTIQAVVHQHVSQKGEYVFEVLDHSDLSAAIETVQANR